MNDAADELLGILDQWTPRFRAMDPRILHQRSAPGKWSIQEILGHLIDSAANNHQRFVRAQHTNPLVLPKYEQDDWVRFQGYEELPWPEVVDLWFAYNRHLAHVMRRIPARARDVECRIGPYEPVTLAYIVHDYNTHLRHHLAQIEAIEMHAEAVI